MKITVDKNRFRDEFMSSSRKVYFSYNALGVLFDYLEEVDEDMELDVIAICCEWNEYETAKEALEDMGYDLYDYEDEEDMLDRLHDMTTVLTCEDSILVMSF